MRIKWLAAAVLVPLVLTACGQGDSGNVMAPDVNTLSAAQIDAALGPENGAVGPSQTEPVNETNVDAPAVDSPPPPARPAPARQEAEAPEAEPGNETAEEPAALNDNATIE